MAQVEVTSKSADAVEATLTFTVNTGEKPVAASGRDRGRIEYRQGTYKERTVEIHNGRDVRDQFSLDRHGFVFMDHGSGVADFRDADELRSVYYPEMERLMMRVSGASRVHLFDHTLRTGDDDTPDAEWMRETVRYAHNDYTDGSGPQRVRDLLPDEAEELLKHRFAVIQIWRPIRSPVERQPLAICDARTIATGDLIATERRRPDRVGEIYLLSFNPDHHWIYFPQMKDNEVLGSGLITATR